MKKNKLIQALTKCPCCGSLEHYEAGMSAACFRHLDVVRAARLDGLRWAKRRECVRNCRAMVNNNTDHSRSCYDLTVEIERVLTAPPETLREEE